MLLLLPLPRQSVLHRRVDQTVESERERERMKERKTARARVHQ